MNLNLQCSSKDKQKRFKNKGSRREADLIDRKVREEDLLAHLSDRFIEVENLDDAIGTSLADIGRFTGVDRCRVSVFNEDFSRLFLTREKLTTVIIELVTTYRFNEIKRIMNPFIL